MESTVLTKETLSYVKAAEEALEAVLEEMPRKLANDPIYCNMAGAMNLAHGYAWAMQRFPTFDPSCLSMCKEQKIEIMISSFGSEVIEVDFIAPAFAVCNNVHLYSMGVDRRQLSNLEPGISNESPLHVMPNLPHDHSRNVAKLAENLHRDANNNIGHISGSDLFITAPMPTIPSHVRCLAMKHVNRFQSIALVWEAEWKVNLVEDPLLIGVNNGTCFLLAKYDASKLEDYISSEFTRDPEA